MSIHLVHGVDPILRDDAVEHLVRDLLGDEDRSLALEEVLVPGRAAAEGEVSGTEARVAAVDAAVNAACTPPLMTARRVVVVREIGNLTKDEAAPLVEYVADPAPTTELVLVTGSAAIAKTLEDAVKAHGAVTGPVSERAADVLERELDAAGLTLSADAREAVLAHVGGDAGLLPSIVETLRAVHGAGARLGLDEITPYLGEAGTAPVWDLTNAIERGDVPGALAAVQRMLSVTSPTQPRPMHPLQVLGMLHGHYRRLLRLDDPAIRSNEAAAAALGGRANPRSAGFRLREARALGTDGLREAFDHLARADLDLKGERAIPSDAVLQVLVARLAGLRARRARSGRSRG